MIGGNFYINRMLANAETLASLGFNNREVHFLSKRPWYELQGFYLEPYVNKLPYPYHPHGSRTRRSRQNTDYRNL